MSLAPPLGLMGAAAAASSSIKSWWYGDATGVSFPGNNTATAKIVFTNIDTGGGDISEDGLGNFTLTPDGVYFIQVLINGFAPGSQTPTAFGMTDNIAGIATVWNFGGAPQVVAYNDAGLGAARMVEFHYFIAWRGAGVTLAYQFNIFTAVAGTDTTGGHIRLAIVRTN